jgi:hypothetical protein
VGYGTTVIRTAQDVIAGRYRLERPVGDGGMGEVWQATDTVLGREVAVKILNSQTGQDTAFLARFRDEARTMAGLRHPGVAPVFDYGEATDDSPAYLVMAYVAGEALNHHIASAGRLGAAETASIVAQAAQALDAVHRAGVIHRDVKPGNLILQPDGSVVLVDFGVARSPRSAQLTGVDEIIGTAAYMAPEQVTKGELSPATDIYALGAVTYQCLAGRHPFPGTNALQVALRHVNDEPPPLPDDVPHSMRAVVLRAMAKDPADRFPSAAAMAAAVAVAGGLATIPTAGGLVSSAGPGVLAALAAGTGADRTPETAGSMTPASTGAAASTAATAAAGADEPYDPDAAQAPRPVGTRPTGVLAIPAAAGIAGARAASPGGAPGGTSGLAPGDTGGELEPTLTARRRPGGRALAAALTALAAAGLLAMLAFARAGSSGDPGPTPVPGGATTPAAVATTHRGGGTGATSGPAPVATTTRRSTPTSAPAPTGAAPTTAAAPAPTTAPAAAPTTAAPAATGTATTTTGAVDPGTSAPGSAAPTG